MKRQPNTKEEKMISGFKYLGEDSKFLIIASVTCSLIFLAVITSLLGFVDSGANFNDWAQMTVAIK